MNTAPLNDAGCPPAPIYLGFSHSFQRNRFLRSCQNAQTKPTGAQTKPTGKKLVKTMLEDERNNHRE
jgi:hypothetical protein